MTATEEGLDTYQFSQLLTLILQARVRANRQADASDIDSARKSVSRA